VSLPLHHLADEVEATGIGGTYEDVAYVGDVDGGGACGQELVRVALRKFVEVSELQHQIVAGKTWDVASLDIH
jgi:hypothetical protein